MNKAMPPTMLCYVACVRLQLYYTSALSISAHVHVLINAYIILNFHDCHRNHRMCMPSCQRMDWIMLSHASRQCMINCNACIMSTHALSKRMHDINACIMSAHVSCHRMHHVSACIRLPHASRFYASIIIQ